MVLSVWRIFSNDDDPFHHLHVDFDPDLDLDRHDGDDARRPSLFDPLCVVVEDLASVGHVCVDHCSSMILHFGLVSSSLDETVAVVVTAMRRTMNLMMKRTTTIPMTKMMKRRSWTRNLDRETKE